MRNRIKKMLGCWMIGTLALSPAACKSDDGNSSDTEEQQNKCNDVCDKLISCDSEEFDGCSDQCAAMTSFMRDSVFNAVADCIEAASCAEVDPDTCMETAAQDVPDAVLDDFIAALCNKVAECEGAAPGCAEEFSGDEEIAGLKMMNDAKLDCVSTCVTGKTCAQFEEDDSEIIGQCMQECGVNMGDDGGGGNGADCNYIAGEWELESISCSGTPQDLSAINVFQDISEDCQGTGLMTFEQCSISFDYDFEFDNGDATWLMDTIGCSDGCREDDCTAVSDGDLQFDVSIDPAGNQLIFTYTTDKAVIDAGMTPCQEGELTIAVYGSAK